MGLPPLNRSMMDGLMRELPKSAGVEVCHVDGVATRLSALDDTFEVRFRLPITYGLMKTRARMNYLGTSEIVDLVLSDMHRTASEMRGLAMRELLDSQFAIEVAKVEGMTAHEACERYGTKLIEMGEQLLRRVKDER